MKTIVPSVLTLFFLILQTVAAVGEQARDPGEAVPLLAALNPTVVDHFYSTNLTEVEYLIEFYGFGYEKIKPVTGLIYLDQQPGTIPLFRLYSLGAADHFYTTSTTERDYAVKRLGYTVEGNAGFVYSSEGPGRVPLFHLHNPTENDHHYTSSVEQRDDAAKNGWVPQGITGYLLQP